MVTVSLRWITPNAEKEIIECARVSSDPDAAKRPDGDLINYLIRHKHWSPFSMASMSVSIENVDRAITRQMLRHSSLRPQEFSQRYQSIDKMRAEGRMTRARLKHPTNRQASLPCDDMVLAVWWDEVQREVWNHAVSRYEEALERGIAKEIARNLLPEGMTPTKMFMNGYVRDWIHYCIVRMDASTQLEHRHLATAIWQIMKTEMPFITAAVEKHYVG